MVPPRLEIGDRSDHRMREFISGYVGYKKLTAEENVLPLRVLDNE